MEPQDSLPRRLPSGHIFFLEDSSKWSPTVEAMENYLPSVNNEVTVSFEKFQLWDFDWKNFGCL